MPKLLLPRRQLLKGAAASLITLAAPAIIRPSVSEAATGSMLRLGVGGGGAATDPFYSQTVLLMPFDDTNGSVTAPGFQDFSAAAHGTATVAGTGSISTAQSQFGGSSYRVIGQGCTYGDSTDWQLSTASGGQFTVEMSAYWNTTPINNGVLLSQFFAGSDSAWILSAASSTELYWTQYNPAGTFTVSITTSGSNLATGAWFPIAVDQDASNNVRVYVNGVMRGKNAGGGGIIGNSSRQLWVGQTAFGGSIFDGWVDNIRITKGTARYASDGGYTPATAQFPTS